ncbi:dimethyl sulfoxide reductase anchor subunit family protein [Thermodesulfobacteriota bacterium]
MHIQWPLVLFTLFNGLGVGAFCYVAITEWFGMAEFIRFPGAITALVALWIGGLASVFHLSHPFRAYNIIRRLNTGIGKELIYSSITGGVIFLYIILLIAGMMGITVPTQLTKIVVLIGFISGVILAFEMGANYVLPSRPSWNTWFWPFVYASSASVVGLFAIYFWAALLGSDMEELFVIGFNKVVLIALIIEAAVILAYGIFLKNAPHQESSREPARILTGDLAPAFWVGIALCGLVVPLLLTIWIQIARSADYALIAAMVGLIGALVGGGTIRGLMYVLGSEIDPIL